MIKTFHILKCLNKLEMLKLQFLLAHSKLQNQKQNIISISPVLNLLENFINFNKNISKIWFNIYKRTDVMSLFANGDFKTKLTISYFKVNSQLFVGLEALILNSLLWPLVLELFQDFNKLPLRSLEKLEELDNFISELAMKKC